MAVEGPSPRDRPAPAPFTPDQSAASTPRSVGSRPLSRTSSATKGGAAAMGSTARVQVAVRVRPFNERELRSGMQCVVSMRGNQTSLRAPASGGASLSSTFGSSSSNLVDDASGGASAGVSVKTFTFDHCFWSFDSLAAAIPATPDGNDEALGAAAETMSQAPCSTQEDVYVSLARPVLQNALDDFNGSIFAYGRKLRERPQRMGG